MEKDATVTEYVSHCNTGNACKNVSFFAFLVHLFHELRRVYVIYFQIIRGLLKYWPKTCTQKEVRKSSHGWMWFVLDNGNCGRQCVYKSGLVLGDVPGGD